MQSAGIRAPTQARSQRIPSQYVNFHAFVANLDERRIFRHRSHVGHVGATRSARNPPRRRRRQGQTSVMFTLLAAAQWILWYGQSLVQAGPVPQGMSPPMTCAAGSQVRSTMAKHSSASLRARISGGNGFKAVVTGEKEEKEEEKKKKKGFGQECKNAAGERRADLMISLEKNMTF